MIDMNDVGDRNRKAILLVLILVITGASFYLGFYLGNKQYALELGAMQLNSLPQISLIYSPDGEAEDKIIELIQSANISIDLEMYILTNPKLANALTGAKKKGVEVRVILGSVEGQNIADIITILTSNGIEVKDATADFKTMHSKIMVVDGKIVLVGSHNWSQSAMFFNREISLIIQSSSLASELENIFNSDWQTAKSIG